MRMPRDITGKELVKSLGKYGYKVVKQTGSHIRILTDMNGVHHVTVPSHDPLKVGTLNNVLNDVALHLNMSKDELMKSIFII